MKKAIVTGASGAIGSAIVSELNSNLDVEVIGLSSKDCDFSSLLEVNIFLEKHDFSDVSTLILCAGINVPTKLDEVDSNLFLKTMSVNLFSQKLILDKVVGGMVQRGYGRIVGISSLYSHKARTGRWAYSASKAALETLIRSVAVEYANTGILANCVTPGFIDTALTRRNNRPEELSALRDSIPLARLGESKEIARVVRFLASSDNTYITGQSIVADGGFEVI